MKYLTKGIKARLLSQNETEVLESSSFPFEQHEREK